MTDLLLEADRILAGNKLGKPTPERRNGRWHRDPSAHWDWFYELPEAEQRYIRANHMVDQGIEPDVVATWTDQSVDEAMWQWVLAIRGRQRNDPSEWWGERPDETPTLVGMRGVAELLGVSASTPRQWKARGLLPDPAMVIDGTFCVWEADTIREWYLARSKLDNATLTSVDLDF